MVANNLHVQVSTRLIRAASGATYEVFDEVVVVFVNFMVKRVPYEAGGVVMNGNYIRAPAACAGRESNFAQGKVTSGSSRKLQKFLPSGQKYAGNVAV